VIEDNDVAAELNSPWETAEERARKREHDRNLKKEAVLLAAAQAFNESGYHNTTLENIADRLNVTKPTIYYYVSKKEEILCECFRAGCGVLLAAADEVEQSDLAGLDKLAAFMRRYAELVTTDFVMNVVRLDVDGLEPETRAEITALKSAVDQRIRSYVQEGIDNGTIAECDPKMTTFALAGALNWIGRWYDSGGALQPSKVAEAVVGTLVEGLRVR
jgi:AcrR family transcriptional regulator